MTRASQQPADWKPRAEAVPQDVRAALATMPAEDLLRLRAIAKWRARSLPPAMSWSDLLHEAVVRALAGTRPWPPGVPLVAFLAGVMRSLCDEQWRRRRLQDALPAPEATNATDDPERAVAATEAIAAIHRLFAADAVATRVITGLLSGMSPGNIRRHYGLSDVEYDTARRRMRRAPAWIDRPTRFSTTFGTNPTTFRRSPAG